MKRSLFITVLLLQSILLFGQQEEHLAILETDSSWGVEYFHFPLQFARDIDYEGHEDARFLPGWIKQESPNFWTYAFAWNIKLNRTLTELELEDNLQLYYDGLMKDVNKDTSIVPPPTTAVFIKKSEGEFVGKVRIHDAFATNKPLVLNALVSTYYCEEKKKAVVLFKLSPQTFDHYVWQKLKEVKPRANTCDL